MNRHTATRKRAGLYVYRGYTIENMEPWDSECKFWNITPPNEDEASDAENTLHAAKWLVDQFENYKEKKEANQ